MSNIPFKVVIPARYDSTRLPGKVLLDIAGKPMLEHVYQRAVESGAEEIVIATDSKKVFDTAKGFGAKSCMTSSDHCSGTDRIAEVCEHYQWPDDAVIVNLQGDEPLIHPDLLFQVANDLLEHPDVSMSTLCTPIVEYTELFDPNVVKVVRSKDQCALYFSRASIPWNRDRFASIPDLDKASNDISSHYFRHLGIYCYRTSFLNAYSEMESCDIEQDEALEQLRVLWHGHKIYVSITDKPPGHGVDTKEDLLRVTRLLKSKS